MITDVDIQKLKKVFATKDDLKSFATKDVVNNIAVEVVGIKHKIADIEERMATKDDLRKVMTTVESVLGEVKAMREEQSTHYQQHEDNRLEHKEFRKRLDQIESVPVIAHQIKH